MNGLLLLVAGLVACAPGPARAEGLRISGDSPARSVLDAGLNLAAASLANALQHSRDAARQAGTQPVPAHVRRALRPWFPADLLDSVEYRVGAPEEASVQSLALRYGDAIAVAVIDTIIFAEAAAAETDLVLWAHELEHVAQFRAWGVYGFAQAYVRDAPAVERAAQERATAVRKALSGG